MAANLRELEELERRLYERAKAYEPNSVTMTRALHRIGILLEGTIKRRIVERGLIDTGRLINSIAYRVDTIQDGGQVTVGSEGVIYARIHEFGGIIRPNNPTGYLRFQTKNGSWVTTKQVQIPARPYMRPSLQERTPDILTILREAFRP